VKSIREIVQEMKETSSLAMGEVSVSTALVAQLLALRIAGTQDIEALLRLFQEVKIVEPQFAGTYVKAVSPEGVSHLHKLAEMKVAQVEYYKQTTIFCFKTTFHTEGGPYSMAIVALYDNLE